VEKLQQHDAERLRELAIEDLSDNVEIFAVNGEEEKPSPSEPALATDKIASALISDIDGTVKCLIKLIPNLCDPFPGDLYSQTGSQSDAYPDIDIVRGLFPSATPALILRLGNANWKRRQSHKMQQEKGKPGMPFARGKSGNPDRQKKAPMREIAVDAFNFQKPTLKTASFKPENTFLQVNFRSTAAPSISEVTDNTMDDSVFTETRLKRIDSKTSFGDMSGITDARKPVTRQPVTKLAVPKPPVPLEIGQTFKCPYCSDMIDVGKHIVTDGDWERHLFGDLEPYLCTFDNCLRAEKTYGARDEWFRHELDSHRIKKVWVCQRCGREEFDTSQAFEEHLQNEHGNVCGPSQVAMMVSLCMKNSEAHLKVTPCPLCPDKLKHHELRDHISNHLEQLALTSVDGDDSSEEGEIEEIGSQKWDDNMSEGRTKLQILNAFVEEQFGIMNADGEEPPDKDLDRTNLEFAGDVSDDGGSSKAEHPVPQKEIESRNWRMTNFLGNQPGEPATAGEKGAQRSRSLATCLYTTDARLSRSPNAVPLIRTASYPEDEDFIGRDSDLANLYKILSVPGRLCIVSATGGMGKTATAVEFTYRYEQSFNCIFWVQAETRVGAADTFSYIATALNLAPDGAVQDQEQMVELSREFLDKTQKRWLLVFDNVNEWADIEDYLPTKTSVTNGSILITTRLSDLSPNPIPTNYFRINLKELRIDEGRSLLIKGLRPELRHEKAQLHPEWRIAGEIAALAGLPLAILHISGYVKASGCTLAEFLELWNEWRRNSLPAAAGDSLAPGSDSGNSAIQTIWNIGLGELGADALKLLKILAFLDSDSIQEELLFNDHSAPGLQFLGSSSSFRFRKMVTDLSRRRLITIKNHEGKDLLQIHRLLQHRLLQDMNMNQQENDQMFWLAFELVRQRLPRPSIDTPEPAKWNLFKEYLPHVLSLQRVYAGGISIITPNVGLAELFRDGGILLWQRFILNDACKLLNSAESILDKLDVKEDQLRVDIHIATTLLIQYFGISHRAESRDRFQKILQIRREYKANTPPEKYTQEDVFRLNHAFADYANALLQFNDYKEAEPIYQKCYERTLEWGKEIDNPFECAKLKHHLAFCRMYHRDFGEAIRLSERAIELVQMFPEKSKQLLLRYKFDLACIILQSGEKERALEMHKEILMERMDLQGRASYFTLQSYYAVGALCSYLGRYDEAE
jgi:tetratricopeptide (TPR) repeat protein